QTMVVPPGAGTQAGTPEPSASPGADMEQTMVVPPSAPAVPSDMEQTTVVPTPPASPAGGTPSAAPSEGPLKAPLNESQVADLVKTAARDVMENVIWDILPGVAEMQMKRFNPPAGAEPSAVASKPVLSGQEADMQVGDVAKDMMEKAAWDAVPEMAGNELQGTPGGPGASPPGGKSGPGEAEARQLVEQLAKEVIERVAWEVVPALAEDIINKELEKIKTRQ
ncbi:MAG TPA: hypothetical protein VLB09_00020, partial [Nitrospiria bacterium]|nr:hypothetical protein [Nitrospiria bacterium]